MNRLAGVIIVSYRKYNLFYFAIKRSSLTGISQIIGLSCSEVTGRQLNP